MKAETSRFDLFRVPLLGFMLKNKFFLFSLRVLVLGLFLYAIWIGFYNNSFTTALFWGLFWPLFMILSLAFLGRFFCGICPHGFIGNYLTKWGLAKEMPKWLKSPSIGVGILLIGWWAVYYAAPNFYKTSFATSVFFLILTLVAIYFFALYKEMSYCKYICPIGTISRVYSKMGMTWLSTEKSACAECKTFDCAKACSANLKPFTFEHKNSMGDCTLCMDCADKCSHVTLSFVAPASSLMKKFHYNKVEVWAVILITAAISITMTFHHALGRTALASDFIWSKSGIWLASLFPSWDLDWVGISAFLFALLVSVGIVAIGMRLASLLLNDSYEKTFYTLGYAFVPLFIIGGLSHLLEFFFLHHYATIVNGFIVGFALPFEPVGNLANRGDGWLKIFGLFPYVAVVLSYIILAKRIQFFDATKAKKFAAFIFASSLITLFLGLNVYKIYVYKTYGFTTHAHHSR